MFLFVLNYSQEIILSVFSSLCVETCAEQSFTCVSIERKLNLYFVKIYLISHLRCLIKKRKHFVILAEEKLLTWHFGGIMKPV